MKLVLLCSLVFVMNLHAKNDWKKNPEFSEKHPCYMDLAMNCRNSPLPSEQNHYRCLGENFSELSNSCRKFMVEFRKPFPCSEEILKLCPGKKANVGQSMNCLKENLNSVSKRCQDYVNSLDQIKKDRDESEKSCQTDLQKLCPGAGPIAQQSCLEPHFENKTLSPACMKNIEKLKKDLKKRMK